MHVYVISVSSVVKGLRSFPRSPHTGGNLQAWGENWKIDSLMVERRRILPIGLLS